MQLINLISSAEYIKSLRYESQHRLALGGSLKDLSSEAGSVLVSWVNLSIQ